MKATLRKISPWLVSGVRYARHVLTGSRQKDEGTWLKVARAVNWTVADGPFQGMQYSRLVLGTATLGAKLLGTYESEITESLLQLLASTTGPVVNIGAAEGYYAIGIARREPSRQIHAFEGESVRRWLLYRLRALNAAENSVVVHAACSHDSLRALDLTGALVLCDIEGGEQQLLDPAKVPALLSADIIVEVHDGDGDLIRDELSRRFQATHILRFLPVQTAFCSGRLPGLLSDRDLQLASQEFRTQSNGWLIAVRHEPQRPNRNSAACEAHDDERH